MHSSLLSMVQWAQVRHDFVIVTQWVIHLWQVYINAANVDEYLITSIVRPADDPNAGEVYYRYEINCFCSFPFGS